MAHNTQNDNFWMKYRRFAKTEIMLYLVMILIIVIGFLIFG
ncbi:hypothetical protein [Pedobacter sp. BS3]|nr:hypothetical protein [Pedobacter sp. BS3]